MKKALRILFKLLEGVPIIGIPIKVSNLDVIIRKLERKGDLKKAREVREAALKTIPFSHQGPLLRSEGEDKLYKLKDYKAALEIFEKAVDAMHQAPSTYGITAPDRVYAGASQAALFCGKVEKSTEYYFEFAKLVEEFSKDKKLDKALDWHKATMKYLESQLMPKNINLG